MGRSNGDKSFPVRAYPVLAQVSLSYSRPKGTFPRITLPSAADVLLRPLDLHVLSLPPAFALSQDQTLKLDEIDLGRSFTFDEVHPLISRTIGREPEKQKISDVP